MTSNSLFAEGIFDLSFPVRMKTKLFAQQMPDKIDSLVSCLCHCILSQQNVYF